MTAQSNTRWSEALVALCRAIISSHASDWPPTEEKIAEQCISFFGLSALSSSEALTRLLEDLGIKVSTSTLPKEFRGYHHCFGDQRMIIVAESKALFLTHEHTLLHELREILEHILQDLEFPTVQKESLETRAEAFAVSIDRQTTTEFLKMLFDGAQKVQSKWRRWAAYALLMVFGSVSLSSVSILPKLEDELERS